MTYLVLKFSAYLACYSGLYNRPHFKSMFSDNFSHKAKTFFVRHYSSFFRLQGNKCIKCVSFYFVFSLFYKMVYIVFAKLKKKESCFQCIYCIFQFSIPSRYISQLYYYFENVEKFDQRSIQILFLHTYA